MSPQRMVGIGILFLFVFATSPVSSAIFPSLPRESWFTISTRGKPAGFSKIFIARADNGHYRVTGESSVHMSGFGFSRQAVIREEYLVDGTLALLSLRADLFIDGKTSVVTAKKIQKKLHVLLVEDGERKEISVPLRGDVYPGPLLNMLPVLRQNEPGNWSFTTFDVEEQRLKEVTYSAVGKEMENGVTVWHLTNDMYSMASNDIWVDAGGMTRKESVRDGLVDTMAVSPQEGRLLLVEDALSGTAYAKMWSMMRTASNVPSLEGVQEINIRVAGYTLPLPPPFGREQAERLADGTVSFTITDQSRFAMDPTAEDLMANDFLPVSDPRFMVKAAEIAGDETNPSLKISKIHAWSSQIQGAEERREPAQVLEKGRGNQMDRVRLTVCLLRAAGIPARFVAGIVYERGEGFVLRPWAEAYAGVWVSVDPLDAFPADMGHVRLLTPQKVDGLLPLGDVLGHLTITGFSYRERRAHSSVPGSGEASGLSPADRAFLTAPPQ